LRDGVAEEAFGGGGSAAFGEDTLTGFGATVAGFFAIDDQLFPEGVTGVLAVEPTPIAG
jgi:hypothetical protein